MAVNGNLRRSNKPEIITIFIVLILTVIFFIFEVLDICSTLRHFCLFPFEPFNRSLNVNGNGIILSFIRAFEFGIILLSISLSFVRYRKTKNVTYIVVIVTVFLVFILTFILISYMYAKSMEGLSG